MLGLSKPLVARSTGPAWTQGSAECGRVAKRIAALRQSTDTSHSLMTYSGNRQKQQSSLEQEETPMQSFRVDEISWDVGEWRQHSRQGVAMAKTVESTHYARSNGSWNTAAQL